MLYRRSLIPVIGAAIYTSKCCYTTLPHLKAPAALPKLPYPSEKGIAPTLSPRQVELHYTRHHKAYIDKFNSLLKDEEKGKTIEELIIQTAGQVEKKVFFNQAAQHFNHSFYWDCLAPNGKPMSAAFKEVLEKEFGSLDKFKERFEQAALNNFGSGWTWLCVSPKNKQLVIDNTSNAGCPITSGLRPILTVDVWEHAYYKDFENKRLDYVKEIWNIINWEFVEKTYRNAVQ